MCQDGFQLAPVKSNLHTMETILVHNSVKMCNKFAKLHQRVNAVISNNMLRARWVMKVNSNIIAFVLLTLYTV